MALRIKKKFRKQTVRKKVLLNLLAALFSIALLVYGVYGLVRRENTINQDVPVIETELITESVAEPSESLPEEACRDYKVAADMPRRIIIPSLNISGCIQRVGIDQENNIAVPTNIHLAGWYADSAIPGESGVSIVAGHVLGRYLDAIFAKLNQLPVGEIIEIEMGDLSIRRFEVKSIDNYDLASADKEIFASTDGIEKQLNLITCSGEYDDQERTYKDRLLVRAQLLE